MSSTNQILGSGLVSGAGGPPRPSVVVTTAESSPINTSPFEVTITFSAAVSGFVVGDITVVNGSAGNFATADNTVFTADITPTADGDVEVSVAASVATSVANGTDNRASNTLVVEYDTTAPSGYGVTWVTDPINAANDNAVEFEINNVILGLTYDYTITSSGGAGSVSGSGTTTSFTQTVSGVDVSGLPDGTLTVTLTQTDEVGNEGATADDTATKDTAAPTGYAAVWQTDPINASNDAAAAFDITSAEVGASYEYTIISNNGGTPVTGSGTIASATESITGLDVTGLNDGILTVGVTLTDTAGNAGIEVTDTVTYDRVAPAGYAVAWVTDPVTSSNETSVEFQMTSAEVGATYDYEITSSGGGTAVTGSGTISTATQSVSGVDVSGLNDGTLTVGVTLTDTAGNDGAEATDTVDYDSTAPSGFTVAWTTDPIDDANDTAAAFDIGSAEVGASYDYTITSDGGAGSVTGSGTIASATESVTGLDVSGLPQGTLTASVTLTDTVGNESAAVTDTVTYSTGPALGTLGNQMYNTETASLSNLYMVDEDFATAKNNPGLADSSGNGNTAIHLATGSPSFDGYFEYQQGPQDNIQNFITQADGQPAQFGWFGEIGGTFDKESWTLLAFVNNTNNAAGAVSLVDRDGGNTDRIMLRLYDSNALLVDSNNGAGSRIVAASASATVNDKWVMVAVTSDNGTVKVYVDGVDVTPGSTTPLSGTYAPSHIVGGCFGNTGSPSAGSISGSLGPYAYWSTPLTAQQISDIWDASGLGGP